MGPSLVLLLRVMAGLGLSAVLGFASLILARVLLRFVFGDLVLGGYLWAADVYVVMVFCGMGTAAGVGTALGWLGSDLAPKLRSLQALGWVVLGVAAAWAAYGYKTVIDPYVTYESNDVTAAAILWAVLLPNVVATAFGLYRQIRLGYT